MNNLNDPNFQGEFQELLWIILKKVAHEWGQCSPTEILGSSRSKRIAIGRTIFAVVLRRIVWVDRNRDVILSYNRPSDTGHGLYSPISFPLLGKLFGRDHTTWSTAVQRHNRRYGETLNPIIERIVEDLKDSVSLNLMLTLEQ